MDAKTIVTISIAIASFLFVTLIPAVIGWITKYKAYKNAKTDAEKQAILNELNNSVVQFISDAEKTFSALDETLKSRGSATGSGAMKKETVLTKIQSLCLQKGIEYDANYWSNKVDELVKLTNTVNTKK